MSRVVFLGSLEPSERGPYIYFIRKERFLYLGETQNCPVIRWASHLTPVGSFRNALMQADSEIAKKIDLQIAFGCWRLEGVASSCDVVSLRRTTQYIEHMLHILVLCNSRICPRYTLISDTTRTAPVRAAYPNAQADARNILDDLILKLPTTPA